MNLSIRNELPSLRNLQNASRATALQAATAKSTAPPDGSANAAQTAQIQSKMKDQFAAQAQDPRAFHDLMSKVYGEGYDQNKAEQLRQKALQGDFSWLPPVRLLDSAALHGANGAYDAQNGVVYINADVAASNPDLAAATFVEEAGAHLDTMLNRGDAAGDEGELLRRIMGGEKLSQAEVTAIKTENDHGTITVDGKQVNVEFWNPLKSIKNAAKAVGGAIKSVAGAVKDTVVNVGKNLYRTVENVVGGVGKMTVGFVGNLIKGNVGDAFGSLFSGARDITFGTVKNVFRTTFTAVGDVLKVPTHLLPDSVGQKIRNGIEKAEKHVIEQSVFATELFGRIFDMGTKPVASFLGGLEQAVRKGLSGDFKDMGKAFLGSFKDFGTTFVDTLKAFTDGMPEEDRV